jgi:hypothetical protein
VQSKSWRKPNHDGGLLNGRDDLDDNLRMLKSVGAKFIGRSLCLWGGESNLLRNLERAKEQLPKVHAADPDEQTIRAIGAAASDRSRTAQP